MKGVLVVLAKLAFTVALLALVVRAFDVRGVTDHLARIGIADALLLAGIALAVVPLQALRWHAVLAANGTPLPLPRVLSILLIGHFFNQTLPSSVGGDAVRMWCAYRAGLAASDAVATVIVDRAASLLGMLALTACGLPWLLELVPDSRARLAVVILVASGIGSFAAAAILARFSRLLPEWWIARPLLILAALASRVSASPRHLSAILALSIAAGVMFSAMVFQASRALGAGLSLAECVLLVPPVLLVSAIPVSVAGWGLREGAMVVALGFVGIAPAPAFAISVLFGLGIAVASLPGAGLWLAGGRAAGSLAQAVGLAVGTDPGSVSAASRVHTGARRGSS
ncbi:MAG TPA: lysylphosphatidylglycerol synthase transmembrane domain-containing protein [Burkholderiales bacterium]|nr:lysylphosphatidylglycerol synthase transmembrane domain-containing protein [Burkholderiales bacterium]